MTENIRWLTRRMIEAFHAESLSRFGGASGLRDEGLHESALGRPQNAPAYDAEASLFDLAALYCLGILKNHPFVDGNKRTGLLAGRVFLALNGYRFQPDEAETVHMILAAAASDANEKLLSKWFAENSVPK
ncbi:MAG: type II toxin-antitoxin system death-on-curing family toxin [Alphaproteobacteria bacterium]